MIQLKPDPLLTDKRPLRTSSQKPGAAMHSGSSLRLPERILTWYLRPMMKSLLNIRQDGILYLPPAKPGREYSLYIHIPFCETLCPYCSFNRFIYHEELSRGYFIDLRAELDMIARLGYQFNTMYIGGGTPTIMIDELTGIIDQAKQLFHIREVSCETNPNHLIPEIITKLESRVDRLSVGVQSFDPSILHAIGRLKKFGPPELILERIAYAAPYFSTFNVDMIFNFPGQTEVMIRSDIDKLIHSAANQVTFYPLMVSESVRHSIGTMGRYDPKAELGLYKLITRQLTPAFNPESVWTFSRQEQKLIDEYIADSEEYLGVGSGSFSYLDGSLYVNTFSLASYHKAIKNDRLPLTGHRRFSRSDQMKYRFLMQFFNRQLDKHRFQKDFGLPVEIGVWKELLFMKLWGAIHSDGADTIQLDTRKQYLIVVMMREFFNSVNQLRDQARRSLSDEERFLCQITDQG
jgi:coproporphyrinogen III oxidase-like Fe-S oxidoreductase